MATNTTATATNHTGNGSTNAFAISFSFLANDEVDVTVGGVLKTLDTHYTISGSTVTFTSGNTPGNGVAVKFQRDTNISTKKVDFTDGSVLTETDLDTNSDQVLFAQQEITDKLAGVEEGATADQTAAEIRTLTESASDSNVFTDADHTKLNNIEANATQDQTISEIKSLIAGSPLDASHLAANSVNTSELADDSVTYSKLQNVSATDRILGRDSSGAGVVEEITPANLRTMINVEDGATADQTNAEIKTAYEANSDTNAFTDAEKTKLNSVETNAKDDQTASEIKTLYESNSDTNALTDAEKTKLSGIETSADVTDATNVDAAGAVMNSDLDGKGEILVGDGSGDPTALSVGTNGYILTADSTEATGVKWAANAGGGGGSGISNVVEDTTPQLGGNLDVQTNEITTSTNNGNIKATPNGTGLFEIKGNTNAGTLQLNCENNSHGVKIKSPAHSAAADYTLTLPVNVVNGQFLKTDTNGVLSWAAVDLTALSASNLTSGTVPDARFPATLPAASAANLTSIPAGNLTGTVADARISALTASKLTGALPAIDGSNLTGISAGVTSDAQNNTVGGTGAGASFSGTDATNNTLFGKNAGNAITTADDCVAVGEDALAGTTTGSNNIGIGVDALKANTTGTGNIAIGRRCLDANIDGDLNVAVGQSALGANTASNNTALGYIALGANTTGTSNVAVGANALDANTTANNNTALGTNSLTTNITGAANTALGAQALQSNTASNNVGIGYLAGNQITSGTGNTTVGTYSLDACTTGGNNTAVGTGALGANTTASNNTAVGKDALKANTTGAGNTAVGVNALDAVTDKGKNTAIGYSALGNSTQQQCTAVGYNAAASNTTGYITAVGHSAGGQHTTGDQNTCLGNSSMQALTTGSYNTALGQNALYSMTTSNHCTAIGRNALFSTTGGQNTAVGKDAGNFTTTGSNNSSFGFDAKPSSATANNEVTLGNGSVSTLRCNQTSISSLSDKRDKTDIINLPLGLEFLNTLRPVKFKWQRREPDATDGTVRAGFIAQELQAAQGDNDFLDLVMDNNPDKLEAKQGNLIPVLVKAIQELSAKVTALEAG